MNINHFCLYLGLIAGIWGWSFPAEAVTVYFKDGTQIEVDSVTRIGNSVCLFVDVSMIDTARTQIKELQEAKTSPKKGLAVVNVDFSPSEDNTEIIATGNVVNHLSSPVQRIRVTVILMDKGDNELLTIHGYVRPEKMSPGQTGSYRLQVKKPHGFWKASVDVQADVLPQP